MRQGPSRVSIRHYTNKCMNLRCLCKHADTVVLHRYIRCYLKQICHTIKFTNMCTFCYFPQVQYKVWYHLLNVVLWNFHDSKQEDLIIQYYILYLR